MSHACFVIWLVKFQKRSLKQSKRRTILAVRTGFGCWTSTPVWWMLSTAAKCIGNIHTQIVCRDYYKVIFSFFLQIFGGNVSNDQYYIMFEVSTARFFCFGFILISRLQNCTQFEVCKDMFEKAPEPYVMHFKKVEKWLCNKVCLDVEMLMDQVRYASTENTALTKNSGA